MEQNGQTVEILRVQVNGDRPKLRSADVVQTWPKAGRCNHHRNVTKKSELDENSCHTTSQSQGQIWNNDLFRKGSGAQK